MKRKIRAFSRRIQYPVITALALFPLLLLIHSAYAPELVNVSWRIPACYLVLATVNLVLWRKLRILFALLGGAAMVYLCYRDHTGTLRWLLMGEGAVYAVLLLWSLPFGSWEENRELAPGFLWLGGGLYALCMVIDLLCRAYEMTTLQQAMPWITYGAVIYLLLAVLSMNRQSLLKASTGRQSVPQPMRRKNLWMTLLVFGGALLVALVPGAARFLWQIVAWLITGLMNLLFPGETVAPTEPPETTVPVGSTDIGFGDLPSVKPSVTAGPLLFLLAKILLVVFVAGLAFMLLRKLFRGVKGMLAAMAERMTDGGEDYEDEITDLREQKERARKERREKRDRWLVGDRGLPPGEKVRYRFRLLLRRHPEWNESVTARETLPEELAGLYERVRYGDRTVSEEDAKNFRKETKKL